jgi:hypothetical protein
MLVGVVEVKFAFEILAELFLDRFAFKSPAILFTLGVKFAFRRKRLFKFCKNFS